MTLLAHGSPDPRHARDVGALVARLASSGITAHAAFLDHNNPRPPQLARQLAERDVADTTVVPLLVGPAYHARVDVPAAVAAMRSAAPDLAVAAAEPVGVHPLVLRGAVELIAASDAHLGPRTGVILAFTGSRDLRAVAAIEALVRAHGSTVAEQLGVRAVRTSYLDGGRPVGRIRTLMRCVDGCTDFVAVTVLIADGVLRDRIVASAERADVPVVPGTLADTAALADLAVLRAGSAPRPSIIASAPSSSSTR